MPVKFPGGDLTGWLRVLVSAVSAILVAHLPRTPGANSRDGAFFIAR